jgi:tRNA(Ile)-lysidine synthetase-like protein
MLEKGKNNLGNRFSVVISDSKAVDGITAAVSTDKISGNLFARQRISGDRIRIGGMSKSVKKLMCDKKVPLEFREHLPVIYDQNGIVYIPYLGIRDGMSAKNDDKVTYITLIDG